MDDDYSDEEIQRLDKEILRNQAAIAAMQSLLVSGDIPPSKTDDEYVSLVAERAVQFADALVAKLLNGVATA